MMWAFLQVHFCPISSEWLPVGVKFLVYSFFFLKKNKISHTQKGVRLGQEQDPMYILVWLILQDEVVRREESGEDSGEKGNHIR